MAVTVRVFKRRLRLPYPCFLLSFQRDCTAFVLLRPVGLTPDRTCSTRVGRHPKPSETADGVIMGTSIVLRETTHAIITPVAVRFQHGPRPSSNPSPLTRATENLNSS